MTISEVLRLLFEYSLHLLIQRLFAQVNHELTRANHKLFRLNYELEVAIQLLLIPSPSSSNKIARAQSETEKEHRLKYITSR